MHPNLLEEARQRAALRADDNWKARRKAAKGFFKSRSEVVIIAAWKRELDAQTVLFGERGELTPDVVASLGTRYEGLDLDALDARGQVQEVKNYAIAIDVARAALQLNAKPTALSGWASVSETTA